ncbi:MAG TPA: transketolase family protein [Verrucomicrobia bacterium]|nr:transketolase family protein [Verrucomicrobiota bacterium]
MQNPREVYGRTLVELGESNPDIVVLEADLGKSTMTCYFEERFPERFFEMGIGEANMTSFAGGLSLTGKVPFTNSFAVFAAGRAYDQIRMGICISGLNVKIVGSSAGLSDFGDGASHQTFDDVAIMRVLPGMTVLVPADANEVRRMTRYLASSKGPAYMRISRNDMADVTPPDAPFEPGRPVVLRDGSDCVVFAMGAMVWEALQAAEAMEQEGVSVRVVNVNTLKPADEAALRLLGEGMRGAVTIEEHSIIGGLGSLIAYVFRGSGLPLTCLGIADRFGQSAQSYEELLEAYGLTCRHVCRAIRELMERNGKGKPTCPGSGLAPEIPDFAL